MDNIEDNIEQKLKTLSPSRLLVHIKYLLDLHLYGGATNEELCECYPDAVELGLISNNGVNGTLIRAYLYKIRRFYTKRYDEEYESDPNNIDITDRYAYRMRKIRKVIDLADLVD